jgi:hypothetical protein
MSPYGHSPYGGQIGNIRAGLMGTQMPDTYGASMQNPAFQPPMPPGQSQIHTPDFRGPNMGPITNSNSYLKGAYALSGNNIGMDGSGASGYKDRGTMSGQGSPY